MGWVEGIIVEGMEEHSSVGTGGGLMDQTLRSEAGLGNNPCEEGEVEKYLLMKRNMWSGNIIFILYQESILKCM